VHCATHAPIVHRNVKTSNILLDHNLTAKVTDFGASRIIPVDRIQLTTLVSVTDFGASRIIPVYRIQLTTLVLGHRGILTQNTSTHAN